MRAWAALWSVLLSVGGWKLFVRCKEETEEETLWTEWLKDWKLKTSAGKNMNYRKRKKLVKKKYEDEVSEKEKRKSGTV